MLGSPAFRLSCVLGCLALVSIPAVPHVASAHPLAPALLEIRELDEGRAEVVWKTSSVRLPGTDVRPRLPDDCRPDGEPVVEERDTYLVTRRIVRCDPAGFAGRAVGVDGLMRSGTDALVRVVFRDGGIFRAVANRSRETIEIPEGETGRSVFGDYVRLGVEHILGGLDHLLFVFGLLLLVALPRSLLATITSFTAGHSVTLSLAVLGFVHYPVGPIEVLIAASVFALAVELARPDTGKRSLLARRPWLMALAFGLLHGLGFAGALGEVGLPPDEIPLALFSFNVGIEVGQIAFVIVVLIASRILGRSLAPVATYGRTVAVYAMGSLSAMWMLERAIALL